MTKTFHINQEIETQTLATLIAPYLNKGDLLLLYGNLGSGKTFFTSALCKALGVNEIVSSPSFVLLNEYQAKDFSVFHFDLYRLQDEVEVYELGLPDITDDGLTIIEWPKIAENIFNHQPIAFHFLYQNSIRTVDLSAPEYIINEVYEKWENSQRLKE